MRKIGRTKFIESIEKNLNKRMNTPHSKCPAIITAQVPIKTWHEVIGEKTFSDAILDRIVHQSIRIELW